MKILKYNFKSLIICLLAIGFISIFLISCQDDDKLSNQMNQKTMFQGYSDSQIEDELISFLDNLETIRKDPTDPLANEVLELEPILWYMEACVNYKYGTSVQPELVKMDTSYVNFNVSGTTYKLGDVQVSYDNIVDSIAAFFYELEEEEKYFLMANISVAEQTSQNISLQIISSFSLNGIIPNLNETYWYWGMNLGECGSNYGAPLDAADIIMNYANNTLITYIQNCYYTDISSVFVYPFLNTDSENNPLGFSDFIVGNTNQPCLSSSQILFYTNGLIYLANAYNPEGSSIALHWLRDDYSSSITNGISSYHLIHWGKIFYGKRRTRLNIAEVLPYNTNNNS